MEEAGILGNTALLNVVLPSFEPGPKVRIFGAFFERMSTGVRGPGWGPRQQGIAAPFCVGQCSRYHRSPAWRGGPIGFSAWVYFTTQNRDSNAPEGRVSADVSANGGLTMKEFSQDCAMARGFVTCTAENQAKTDRRSSDDLQRHCTSRPREGAQEVCAALCRAVPAKPRRFAVQSVRLTNSRCGTMPFVFHFFLHRSIASPLIQSSTRNA